MDKVPILRSPSRACFLDFANGGNDAHPVLKRAVGHSLKPHHVRASSHPLGRGFEERYNAPQPSRCLAGETRGAECLRRPRHE